EGISFVLRPALRCLESLHRGLERLLVDPELSKVPNRVHESTLRAARTFRPSFPPFSHSSIPPFPGYQPTSRLSAFTGAAKFSPWVCARVGAATPTTVPSRRR